MIVELDKIEKKLKSKETKNVAVKTGKKNAPKVTKKIKRKEDNLMSTAEKKRKVDSPKVAKVCAKRKGSIASVDDAKKKKMETVKDGSMKSVNK